MRDAVARGADSLDAPLDLSFGQRHDRRFAPVWPVPRKAGKRDDAAPL